MVDTSRIKTEKETLKTSILMAAIIGYAVILLSASAADATLRRHSSGKGVSMLLIPEKTTVRLGEPIIVTLQIKTDEQGWVEPECTNDFCFNSFAIANAQGQLSDHVGIMAQWGISSLERRPHIGPSSTLTVLDHIDLTDSYLIREPGSYSIRFIGEHYAPESSVIPDSNVIKVNVTPGKLTPRDQFVSRLFDVLPEKWWVEKQPRTQQEVTPFGRFKVAGFGLRIASGMGRGGINIWFTKSEAAVDPTANPQIMSNHFGRTQEFHVYVAQDTNTPSTPWPNATESISRALGIVKE